MEFIFEDKIRNKTRKNLLLLIYESPKRYQDLASLTGLKPGSVYHHLKLLEPFVEKRAHGLYAITELGKSLVEKNELVESDNKKPSVKDLKFEPNTMENIFTNRGTQLLIILVLALTIHMAQQNVAIAGGAIYASYKIPPIAIDIVSLAFGVGTLSYVASIFQTREKVRLAILVRLYSMLPASIMGLGLLLAYHSGVSLTNEWNTLLFVFSFVGGILVAYAGTHYLLGRSKNQSAIFAAVAAFPDLFIGIVILLIES